MKKLSNIFGQWFKLIDTMIELHVGTGKVYSYSYLIFNNIFYECNKLIIKYGITAQ